MKTWIFAALLSLPLSFSSLAQENSIESMPETITRAKEAVYPSVVFIRSVNDMQDEGLSAKVNISGSGVIISNDGLVLTNWHVINKAERIRCQVTDGEHYQAEVVGSDRDIDIAIIRLKTDRKDFPAAKIESSANMKEGDFVLAMGAPWGMSRSVSFGIISCPKRYLESKEYTLYLQTDATISPGNSGGPLVNIQGSVIGINTLGNTAGGDIGFAVPSSTILQIINDLKTRKNVNWSWIGIDLQAISNFSKDIFFEKGRGGVIVANVEPKSPAEKAGLQTHDRILSINGKKCDALSEESLPDIKRNMALLPANTPVNLEVERAGKLISINLTPVERGPAEGESSTFDRWGTTFAEINRFQTPTLFHHQEKGIYLKSYTEKSNARSSSLSVNDIIVAIDGQKITTLDDVKAVYDAAMKNIDNKTKMTFEVLSNGRQSKVVLDYSTDLNADTDDFFDE